MHNRRGGPPTHDDYCPIPPVGPMRHTEFWVRMEDTLGAGYARVWATQHVLASLGGRTVDQALAEGESPRVVWRAVWAELDLPARER